MPLSEKKKASNARWDEKNLKRLSLAIPIEEYEEMQEAIRIAGDSQNKFMRLAIKERTKSILHPA